MDFFRGTVTGEPIVITLCPSPPSGWLGLGLALTSITRSGRFTLETCAVPGTQQKNAGAQKATTLISASSEK